MLFDHPLQHFMDRLFSNKSPTESCFGGVSMMYSFLLGVATLVRCIRRYTIPEYNETGVFLLKLRGVAEFTPVVHVQKLFVVV